MKTLIKGEKEAKAETEETREHPGEREVLESIMNREEYNKYLVLDIVDYHKELLKIGYRNKSYDQSEKYKKFIIEEAKFLIHMKVLYHKFISDFDTGDILYTCIVYKEEEK